MSLRLAGEELSVVQGLDDLGWPRVIEANDADPGLKITQSGSGPALQVVSGDLSLGANKLKTTNLLLKEVNSSTMAVRNAADTVYKGLQVNGISAISGVSYFYADIEFSADGQGIRIINTDDYHMPFKARDNGVGLVEVARLQSAADPYLQATLPMVLNPSSQPGTSVEGHFWYDSAAKKLKFYNGTAVETVTSA